MFVDEIKIYARAGHGGKGCVAFQREKYRPKGGPSGGNGGRGADVILEADHDLNNLIAQYYNPRLLAPSGEAGLGKGMDGHAGADLVVKVPCGTLVWRLSAPGAAPKQAGEEDRDRPALPSGPSRREVLHYAGGSRAVETDLAAPAGKTPAAAAIAAAGAALGPVFLAGESHTAFAAVTGPPVDFDLVYEHRRKD